MRELNLLEMRLATDNLARWREGLPSERVVTVAKLIFRSGMYAGKNMSLPEGKAIVLGRNRDVDLPLNDPKLSRRHCQILATLNGCVITDMGSTNGTYVNGNRLDADKPLELIEFDRIVLGDTEIELYLSEPGEKILAVSSDDNMPIVRINDDSSPLNKAVGPPPTQSQMKAVDSASTATANESELELNVDPDPLLAALYEMNLPLPPEPPLPSGSQPLKNEPAFCSYCGAKIPEMDRSSGKACSLNNKMACKDCLSKPPVPHGHSTRPGVDAVLAALDNEPTVIDTSKGPRLTAVDRSVEAVRTPPTPTPVQRTAAEKSGDKHKLFGDEFEEIV